MTDYTDYSDTYVEATEDGRVKWVDFGEINCLSPDEAEKFGKQLVQAAVEAEAKEQNDS